MVVTGSSVDQVHVIDKGIAYKRNDGSGESRHKGCTLAGGSNHVDNGSTDDCPAGRCCAVSVLDLERERCHSCMKWKKRQMRSQ